MEGTKDGRFLDDAGSFRAIVGMLGPSEREAYEDLKALSLEAGFPNRRLVVYTLRGGLPEDVSMLLLGDFGYTKEAGPTVTVSDESGPVAVGVRPVWWRNRDLFLQVPQNFILKWKGKDSGPRGVQYVPHYAILIKTRSKEHHQVEGHTYCVTLNKFRERFPEVPIRY